MTQQPDGSASETGAVDEIRIAASWRGAHTGPTLSNPTVLIFFAATAVGVANVVGYATASLPLAPSLGIAVLVAYALWYVMHEASHRLAHRNRLVNDLIGWSSAAPLLLAFPCFVERHQQHHAHTNEPQADPDLAVARTPWQRRLVGLYFPATYRAACAAGGARAVRGLRLEQLAHDLTVLAALVAAFVLSGPGLVAMVLVPPLVIAPVITFTFSYLPHRPFRPGGRYRNTREQHGRVLTIVLFGQNHHLTHHLWVNVPWFRLPRLAATVRDQLRERGAAMDWTTS